MRQQTAQMQTQMQQMQQMQMQQMKQARAPAPAPEPAPAPAAKSFNQDLSGVLSAARLSQYEEALREMGCVLPDDLREVEEADLMELGMKKIEIKRLLRSATP